MPQVSINHLLVDRATVRRNQTVNAGHGRFENSFQPIATNILFRVFTASAKDIAYGQQLRMEVSDTAYVLPEQDVNTGDEVELTLHGGQVTSKFFLVVGVLDPSLVHHRKLFLYRVVRASAS